MDDALGAKTGGSYISGSATVNANLSALDTKIGAASEAAGTYTTAANTVNANIKALDTQISSLNTAVSGLDTTRVVAADNNSEGINLAGGAKTTVAGGKASENSASNITTKVTADGGNARIEVALNDDIKVKTVEASGQIKGGSLTDGTATLSGGNLTGVKDIEATGTIKAGALEVNGKDITAALVEKGKVEDGSEGFIDGNTLYKEVRPAADGAYVKKNNTTASNLTALDDQVKANTEAIGTIGGVENVRALVNDVSGLKSQDGRIVPKGEANADEFVKGETVYEYLNKEELSFGENSTQIAIGKGSQATGFQSLAVGFGNKVSGNNSGAFGDPNKVTGDESYAVGNNNTIGGSNTFVLGNNVTANVDNAVVLGNGSTAEANAVSVGSEGGERQIKHVAAGTDDTDAVNVAQLKAVDQNAVNNDIMLNNRISSMDTKINKVGSGAAALAALHPIDTDDKFTMGLGYGNYRSAHAGAVGMFYRPTDKVMLSVGGTMGNGENMINAGISFALDKGKGFGTSKAAMAKKINALAEENAAIREENASIKEQNAKLEARLAAIEAKLDKVK